jgi:hypothetical protein
MAKPALKWSLSPGSRHYYDGQRWTQHFVPTPPPSASAPPSVAVAVSTGGGTNHALHLILTLLTCGLWLPIWILVAIFDTRGSATAVAGAGASTGPRFNRTPLIIGGVILGLAVLGQAAQHPLLFIPLFLLAGAGGFFFWKQKTAKDAREQELREQYRRDVLTDRAEYEDDMWQQGDPRGTYGRYPPPPEEDLR